MYPFWTYKAENHPLYKCERNVFRPTIAVARGRTARAKHGIVTVDVIAALAYTLGVITSDTKAVNGTQRATTVLDCKRLAARHLALRVAEGPKHLGPKAASISVLAVSEGGVAS